MLSRHIIDKSARLRAIFANPQYERVIQKETTSPVDLDVARQRELLKERRDELTRELWTELHLKINPTKEWFASWLKRVPSYGCKCADEFGAIINTNPPRFDDWFRWTWEAHNAVNAKLGKPEIPWQKACELWGYTKVSPVIENR